FPEVGLSVSGNAPTLLQSETLPRSPWLRVRLQRRKRRDTEQRVQQPAVAQIDLRGLHLPIADVLKPRRQLPHHERAALDVEVPFDRRMGLAQRAPDLRGVPDLPVIMRHHAPKLP